MERNEKIGIKDALELVSKSQSEISGFGDVSMLYRCSNERLISLLDNIDLKGKSVLTICGSGDQHFSFILGGAERVVDFDINKMCEYYLMLKHAGILGLDYEEFLRFFVYGTCEDFREEKGYFDKSSYDKIRDLLPSRIQAFWDTLYLAGSDVFNNSHKSIFRPVFTSLSVPYYNEPSYNELKGLINNTPTFIRSDVHKIQRKTDEKFDIIYLSNVSNYVNSSSKWVKFLTEELTSLLTSDGIIVCYEWSINGIAVLYEKNGFDSIRIGGDYVYTYKR